VLAGFELTPTNLQRERRSASASYGRTVGTSAAPEFMPQRDSEPSGSRGLRADDALRLEFGEWEGSGDTGGFSPPFVSAQNSGAARPGARPPEATLQECGKPGRWTARGSLVLAATRCAGHPLVAR
jgi:hypothetical protein